MYATAFLDIPALRAVAGTVQLPGSKSISNRVLLLSALCQGRTVVHDLLDSDDTRVMLQALRALAENGVAVDLSLMFEYRIGEDSGAEVGRRLLELKKLPDGVFIVSDLVAAGALRALIEAGVRVPDDISVCGFDDIDLARICTPTLTTVAQPMAKIGHRAGEMLFALLEGRDVGERQVILDYEMHLRQSTR